MINLIRPKWYDHYLWIRPLVRRGRALENWRERQGVKKGKRTDMPPLQWFLDRRLRGSK